MVGVEFPGGLEFGLGAGLEAQLLIAAPSGFTYDVGEYLSADSTAAKVSGGAHGFDFSVVWGELPQSTTSRQLIMLPNRPKRDVRLA